MNDSTGPYGDAMKRVNQLRQQKFQPAPGGSTPPVITMPGRGPMRVPRTAPYTPKPRRSVLSLEELERFGNLLVFAKVTVEGYFAGKHKSPFHGSSVEFADHREYVAGDDPKHIDWRAYGRVRKLFVRRYEAETDMVIYLLVDTSRSMDYAGPRRSSKFDMGAKIAAALSYLTLRQGDKAALGLFADGISQFVPPGGTHRHLFKMIDALETAEQRAGTGIAKTLEHCGALFKKRGRLVIVSDFWDEIGPTFDALSRFLHRKFEVLLIQVLDPHELDLPPWNTARFTDMETGGQVEVQLEEIRSAYRRAARARVDEIGREASQRGISHALATSDQPYLEAIEAYLGFRGANALAAR